MVARRAGVSISAVSLVVNGKDAGRISAANAERIRSAVDELGYVVDRIAATLVRGRSDLVILVAPDLANPFFGQVIRGIRAELGDRYRLLLSVTDSGVQPSAADVRQFAALRPAGLLVDAPSAAFLDELGAEEPIVLLDAPGLEDRATAVNYDIAPGVSALVDHLHALGHRTIGYLDASTGTETFARRRTLLLRAARRLGMTVLTDRDNDAAVTVTDADADADADAGAAVAGAPVDSTTPAAADLDLAAAAEVAAHVLPTWRAAGATAVVCAADTLAYGLLAAAAGLGIRVPDELAVAGFDDLPSSVVTAPPLTSVSLPGGALGRSAARRLLAAIDGDGPDSDGAHHDTELLTATLVIRASTAG
ncbi:hypothetical protein ASF23_12160 [Curtobacterium sp. Leaf261]|nr:hypothetical protein ASF23_12160 [Curtobacterium sp. Leaf261]